MALFVTSHLIFQTQPTKVHFFTQPKISTAIEKNGNRGGGSQCSRDRLRAADDRAGARIRHRSIGVEASGAALGGRLPRDFVR